MDLMDVVEKFPKELKDSVILLVEFLRKEDIKLIREEMEKGFKELREAIQQLTYAQKRAEERLENVEDRLTRLEEVVERLSKAQEKAEERLTRLEEITEKLIHAQERTEKTLNKLIKDHAQTREKVENLSRGFGFLLEDRAIQSLPEIFRDRGIEVEGRLKPKRIIYEGKEYEINIYGILRKDGKKYVLFGECKSRISRKEVYNFLKILDRLKKQLIMEEMADDVYPIIVVHRLNAKMEEFLKEKEIDFVESYLLKI